MADSSGTKWVSNNAGVGNSTAYISLTLKQNIGWVSFDYSYSTEASYDKMTVMVGNTTVASAVSGNTTTKSYKSGSVASGEQIAFIYEKDSSVDRNDDKCTFSNMVIFIPNGTTVQKGIARNVK